MASMKYCDKHNQVGFLKKPEESTGFAEIVDFLKGSHIRYALTHNPTIHDSLVKQFWQTATASTLADGTLELRATIDTLEYTITEASVRSKLQLADASGISMLPNTEIFEGMGNMGYPADGTFTFWKSHFTPQWRFLVHHILHCMSPKSGGWDQFGSNLATALICLSTGRIYNFSKLIFDGMVANLKSKTKFLMYPRFLQMILEIQTENKHPYLAIVLTKKIFGNMKRGFRGVPRPLLPAMLPVVAVDQSAGQADQAVDQPSPSEPLPSSSHPPVISATTESEPTPVAEPTPHPKSPSPEPDNETTEYTFEQPSLEHQPLSPRQETEIPQSQDPTHPHVAEERTMTVDDLLQLVPKLITKVDSLETKLKQTNLTMGHAIVKLVKKVKKMEAVLKRRHVVLPDSEDEDAANSSKQGRNLQEEGLDEMVRNIMKDKLEVFDTPTQGKTSGEADISPKGLEAAETLAKVFTQRTKTYTRKVKIGLRRKLDADEVSTSKEINTSFTDVSTAFTDVNTAFEEINSGNESIIPSPKKGQREGKAVLEEKSQSKRTKKQIREEQASLVEIARLQAQEEAENARKIELLRQDALIVKRMQDELELSETQKNRMAQVQEAAKYYTEEDWDLIRAKREASRDLSNKVLSIDFSSDDFAKKMVELIKEKKSQLKKLKPDELKEEFDKCVEKVEKFIPMNSELEASKLKRTCINLQAEVSKKQKITDVPDVTKVESNKSESARSDTEEDVEAYMDERVDEPPSEEFQMGSIPQGSTPVKIVKWQIIKTGKKGAYQIIKEDHTDVVYVNFLGLLNDLTRDDLKELYRLMMLKYGDSRPEEEYERVLWGDLKTMLILTHQQRMKLWSLTNQQKEAHNEDTQRNLKFISKDQVRGGLLGIIVNRLKSGSYRVKSARHS
ncbi:hypothetical protein Tco_0199023 [Tanacetum coccineum]